MGTMFVNDLLCARHCGSSHFNQLISNPCSRCGQCHPHFTDEETEAQQRDVTNPTSYAASNHQSPNSHQNLSDIKPTQQKSPFYLADISSLRSQLATSMEVSLIPPGKVIHILFCATRVSSGPSYLLPGFP